MTCTVTHLQCALHGKPHIEARKHSTCFYETQKPYRYANPTVYEIKCTESAKLNYQSPFMTNVCRVENKNDSKLHAVHNSLPNANPIIK